MSKTDSDTLAQFSDAYWSAVRGNDTGWPFERLYPIVGNILDPQLKTRIVNARQKFAPYDEASERPLALFDSSVFGGCSVGFLLTDRALYTGEGLLSTTRRRIEPKSFPKLQTETDLCLDGQKLTALRSGTLQIEQQALERLVIEDFFSKIRKTPYSFDADAVRSFVDPAKGSSLTKHVAALGAHKIVLLGIQRTEFDDETTLEKVDDLYISNKRVIKLPSDHLLRKQKHYFSLSEKYSEPTQILGVPPVRGQPLVSIGAAIYKFAFNEISKRTHERKLLCFSGLIKGPSPLYFGSHSEDVNSGEIELTWNPDERSRVLSLAQSLKERGFDVGCSVGDAK